KAKYMLPLGLAQTQVQTMQKGPQCRRMLYNELEQGDILSGGRCRLTLLAYTDILLCSIWAIHKIRQSPIADLHFTRMCAMLLTASEVTGCDDALLGFQGRGM